MSLSLRFAARSDVGLIRDGNEDSGYAGARLLAVADGLGGQAAGEVASSAVVSTVSVLDREDPGPEILAVLSDKVIEANDLLRRMIEENPQLEGMGTTLTALLWTGAGFGMVHIGDSRAYLLRQGMLQQVSLDHTWVQRLVDEGRITPDEADHHPQRSLLMRAIDGRGQVDLDLFMVDVQVGDRYLLCSDGLSGVVSRDTLEETLAVGGDPDQVADALVDLARRAGGPDNITVIVADIIDGDGMPQHPPVVVGAASEGRHQRIDEMPGNPAERAAAMTEQPHGDAGGAIPGALATDAEASAAVRPKRRRWLWISLAVAVVVIVAGGLGGAYAWSQGRYYVAASGTHVAIFQGVNQSVLGVSLSSLYKVEPVVVQYLSPTNQMRVQESITATNLDDAQHIVASLRTDMCNQVKTQLPATQTTPGTQPATGGSVGGAGLPIAPTTPAAAAPDDRVALHSATPAAESGTRSQHALTTVAPPPPTTPAPTNPAGGTTTSAAPSPGTSSLPQEVVTTCQQAAG